MSVTVGAMIDEVLGLLESWSLDEEQSTTLASHLTPTSTSFTVTEARGVATGISPGIIEIEQELIYCDLVSGTTATIPPWGRGYKNTVAKAHNVGVRVVSQPTFPRAKTLDAMNQVMQRIFPTVFAVRQYESTTTAPRIVYDVPDDLQWVLTAKWLTPTGTGYWETVDRWRVSPGGGTQDGDGLHGVTVDVADSIPAGRPIQFIYAAKPVTMVNESDDFVTVSGLNAGLRDVVTLGAASIMTVSQELSRLQVSSVEQQNRSQLVAPSAALTSSRYLEQRFQERLLEERRSLQRLYPPRITGVWK